jgi:uncharacterized membrane protein YbhN (UPF0104 family)
MLRQALKRYGWPVVGIGAVALSGWLLYSELRNLSFDDLWHSLTTIGAHQWLLAALSTFVAYAALAWYDRIGLQYLGKAVPWLYIAVSSFTTYALSHNIGASVLSGAVIRYRAYSRRGLTAGEVALLVTFCSFTFALGTVMLAGLVLVIEPHVADHITELPHGLVRLVGILMLTLVALYVVLTRLPLRPFRIGSLLVPHPSAGVVARQLVAAPIELIGAAAIIYFTLPVNENPGFLIVLGVFLASFSVALLSHAPGGLGVLEIVFLTALPDADPADVLASLIVFRLFYLLVPLALALVVVVVFEHSQFGREDEPIEAPPPPRRPPAGPAPPA